MNWDEVHRNTLGNQSVQHIHFLRRGGTASLHWDTSQLQPLQTRPANQRTSSEAQEKVQGQSHRAVLISILWIHLPVVKLSWGSLSGNTHNIHRKDTPVLLHWRIPGRRHLEDHGATGVPTGRARLRRLNHGGEPSNKEKSSPSNGDVRDSVILVKQELLLVSPTKLRDSQGRNAFTRPAWAFVEGDQEA